jgi:hypothetical protein
MDINNDIPIRNIEDEGITIELLDGGDDGFDSQDYVSGTPPMTAGVKRTKHMNHGTNGQQDDYDEDDVDQFTRPVLKRRRVNNNVLMPPPVSTKNCSGKGKHVIKLSSNPPNVRSESTFTIRKGRYLSSRTSSSSTSACVSTSASSSSTSTSASASTSGSTTSATVTASTSAQIDSRGSVNGETSSGTIYE